MRILIVDDEVIIRTGLCTVIDWKELGMELLPPAASAEEALARVPEEKPHIILTDIRMSGMDGIELAKKVKELLPDTEIVILTGYDDFTYAQQALREGVTDYLLKTSRPDEIIKAAMKAKQRILEKWEALKQENFQTAAFRSQLLERLVTQGLDQEPASVKEQLYIWFRKHGVQAAEAELSPMQVLLVSASGWGDNPLARLLLGAADNMLFELLPAVTLLKKDRIVLVARYVPGVTDKASLEAALGRVEQTLKCTAYAALGSIAAGWDELPVSFREAEHVFSFRGLVAARGLFAMEDVKDRRGGRTVCSQKEEAELSAILLSNNLTELRHWVNQKVRTQMEDASVTPASLQAYLQSLVLSAHRWLERAGSGTGASQEGTGPDNERREFTLELAGQPEEELFRLLSSVMSVFHESIAETKFSYIHKSIAYIKENLDQNLTLQQVAKFVHLNPNHFSEVFKRETGLNYIEFVTKERMRQAAELLQGSQAKISEVANRVGYEDIKYFSQQFKKFSGQTPSEFRQSPKG
ncbi:response regulator [Paenibacillus sp. NPDC056579]|uniref:response regulator n=1 Tax=Paenibacillus sp. NPDC056579 TaxID=3345871 RepID=UPI003677CF23